MNQVLTVEVADFVEAVDAALADLPADVRAELLEDLPAHLGDVVAEGGSPRDQLGEPAAYAAELRAAAGYPPASGRPRSAELTTRLRNMDERVGRAIGYQRFTELLVALQPAWWVLRGYLATLVVCGGLGRTGKDAFIPQIDGNIALGLLVLVALCGLSVQLGRRWRGRGRTALAVSTIVAVGLGLFAVHLADRALDTQYVYEEVGNDGGPLSSVTNVYPYGADGTLLHDIRLYDQDGNPISLDLQCSNQTTTPAVPLYPLCPQDEVTPETVTPGGPIAPLPSSATSARPVTPSPNSTASASAPPTSAPVSAPNSVSGPARAPIERTPTPGR